MQFRSDAERQKYWDTQKQIVSNEAFEFALSTLEPQTARALKMFFQSSHTLKEIEVILQISGRLVRRQLQDGIEQLYRYFNSTE